MYVCREIETYVCREQLTVEIQTYVCLEQLARCIRTWFTIGSNIFLRSDLVNVRHGYWILKLGDQKPHFHGNFVVETLSPWKLYLHGNFVFMETSLSWKKSSLKLCRGNLVFMETLLSWKLCLHGNCVFMEIVSSWKLCLQFKLKVFLLLISACVQHISKIKIFRIQWIMYNKFCMQHKMT